MTADTLDPLIHVPARLQIMATLAALPNGDTLSFTRLQDMIGLTPGNLITHLRKLEEADYLTTGAQPWTPTPTRCVACSAGCRGDGRADGPVARRPSAKV
jgi:hypothetical protein